MDSDKEWFSEWFDSPYYHVLYRNRDQQEAEFFLSNLVRFFNAPRHHRIIDLACGKGRHAIFLNTLGYDVTGVDLSAQSISQAKQFENERLHFDVKDLRQLEYEAEFDIAINLFTSFGYFQSRMEDALVISNIHRMLKPAGFVLIDFMNSEVVIRNLVETQSKVLDNIRFTINKKVEKDFIIKDILFADKGCKYEFTERVQALTADDFEQLLHDGGFRITNTFGSYALTPFKRGSSERLIIVAQKNG